VAGPAPQIVERAPTPHEYVELRRRVGWPSPPLELCEHALARSLAAVCAVAGDELVGMGRLVGDGGVYCFAVDVVVDPPRQGQGIGRAVVEALQALAVDRRLATRLDLVAAPSVAPFYRHLGYETRANELMRKPL
jgi:GNAT superfamily N-acetyltransferase